MTREDLLSRISIQPNVCFGKPCIRGTRIWVSLVLDLLATGTTTAELLKEYPQLKEEDIRACLLYGAETARGRFVTAAEIVAMFRAAPAVDADRFRTDVDGWADQDTLPRS